MDAAKNIIAGGNVFHNDPEGIEVENFIHGFVLGVHFAVNGVNMLDPAEDLALDFVLRQTGLNALFDGDQKFLVRGGAAGQLILNIVIPHRVQILKGKVLQLPLNTLHAQPVSDGRIDFHGLQGLFLLLALNLVVHGAHVVQPVADFNENHADVLGHGHEHLAQILHLLFFLAGVLNPGKLGDSLHQIRHHAPEELGDFLVRRAGVLDAVVEQGGDDGVRIQSQIGHNFGHGQGMGDVGGAILAQLLLVGFIGVFKRGKQALGIQRRIIAFYLFLQGLIARQNGVHIDHLAERPRRPKQFC
ncbi:hypothetical protein SDC9_110923 [bioreactor metagenome]|uniref:NAD-specific glutamate dehydrogenase n=1 Tax=bioreactor metagenome TaxID=1076179 RepID=A0A645BFD5_9ZZZZ